MYLVQQQHDISMISFKKNIQKHIKTGRSTWQYSKIIQENKTLCWLVDFIVMVDNFEPKQCKNNEGIFYVQFFKVLGFLQFLRKNKLKTCKNIGQKSIPIPSVLVFIELKRPKTYLGFFAPFRFRMSHLVYRYRQTTGISAPSRNFSKVKIS